MPRTNPRISINKLGEYLATTSATRRRSIIRAQKNPIPIRVAHYNYAREVIQRFIAGGASDSRMLTSEIVRLQSAEPGSNFEKQMSDSSVRAIESFVQILGRLNLGNMSLSRGERHAPKLLINGVAISVEPDILIQASSKKGSPVTGAIKFHFPISNPLTQTGCEYVATGIRWFLEEHCSRIGRPSDNLCIAIDVPAQSVYSAPKAYKKRRRDIEAACDEILDRWGKV
jgi:hypothetical protein